MVRLQWRECRVAQNGDPIERLLFYALLARGTERERERERASTSAVADDFRSRMPLRPFI